jgi:hypothetical protein
MMLSVVWRATLPWQPLQNGAGASESREFVPKKLQNFS